MLQTTNRQHDMTAARAAHKRETQENPYPTEKETGARACGECGAVCLDAERSFCPECRKRGHLHPLRGIAGIQWELRHWEQCKIPSAVEKRRQALKNLEQAQSAGDAA